MVFPLKTNYLGRQDRRGMRGILTCQGFNPFQSPSSIPHQTVDSTPNQTNYHPLELISRSWFPKFSLLFTQKLSLPKTNKIFLNSYISQDSRSLLWITSAKPMHYRLWPLNHCRWDLSFLEINSTDVLKRKEKPI